MTPTCTDQVTAWVAKSCTAQGIPVHITDPGVIRRVAVVVGRTSRGGASEALRPAHQQAGASPDPREVTSSGTPRRGAATHPTASA